MRKLIHRILFAIVKLWNRHETTSTPAPEFQESTGRPEYAPWLTSLQISKLEDQRKRFSKPMGRFFMARLDPERFALYDTLWSPSPVAIIHVRDMNEKQNEIARAMSARMYIDDPLRKKLPWDWQIQYSAENGLEDL